MSLRVNTVANFAGKLSTAAIGALLIPVYVKLLGIEAYALVGISATLQAIFGLLDAGMGAAFSRELARLSGDASSRQEERDLLATFDALYAALAVVVAILVQLIAPLIAMRWIPASSVDRDTILLALRLIGLGVALQIPTALYMGGLLGLERQVLYNTLSVASAAARGLGAVAVLIFVAPTIRNFFFSQVVISAITLVVLAVTLHRLVDAGVRGRFRFQVVRRVWRYAAGWGINAVGTNLAGQLDKVILSRILPLAQFGYYTVASTVAVLLWNLVASVSFAAFPRFNRLIAAGAEKELREAYFSANQLLATVLIPATAIAVVFPRDVLFLWTGDAVLADAAGGLVVFFAAGMAVAGVANVPLHLALAYGWFRLPVAITAIAAVLVAPLMIYTSRRWGAVGGAFAWAIQISAVVVLVPLLHRRLLRGEGLRWLVHALALPVATAGAVCWLAHLMLPQSQGRLDAAAFLAGTWLIASAAVTAVEPDMRMIVTRVVRRIGVEPSSKETSK